MKFFEQLNSDENHRKSLREGTAMNTDKATPRPWIKEFIESENIFRHKLKSQNNGLIANFTRKEDFEYTVKAVNEYDHLKDIEKQVEAVNLYADDLKMKNEAMKEALELASERLPHITMIKDALKLAE